jgi:3-hydroxyacyl-CoA dehydrogenase
VTPAIRSVAVLGAGTMGAQIAAHVANAGLPALLLDLTADIAAQGLKRAKALKPDPFFTRETSALVSTGGFDTSFDKLAQADWIVEAVVERIDVKRPVLERVEKVRRPGSIVSTNTSGIPVHAIVEGRGADFRRHFLGTHFFNPPRYLHLVELVPTSDTDPAIVELMKTFLDVGLGKGVVVARDTPNFIANRIGVYGVVQVLRALEAGAYTVEEIDAITGPALGRPKSATLRTIDIAGLDVLTHVAENLDLELPAFVNEMVARGWIGEKAGQGFYKKSGKEILALDPRTLEYRPRRPPQLGSLEASRGIEDVGDRTRALYTADDKVGTFLRSTLGPTIEYAATVAPEVAEQPEDIDRAITWGFGWERGPLALAPLLGIAAPPVRAPVSASRVVKKNAGASLVDLGDGVLALKLHSKLNAIGADTVEMLHAGVAEAAANFAALVVATDAPNFSAGANLMLLLLEAQEGNWDEIDLMVRAFQNATQALRYADVPVVVAATGLTLGGGCEIALHADRVQAAAETYMGQVEVGVGLIPAGGGTKEMLARSIDHLSADGSPDASRSIDLLPYAQRVFELLGLGTVSTSAAHARQLGFLREADAITMNRDRLLADAKSLARERVREGYRKPRPRRAIPVGGDSVLAALKLGVHLAWRAGRISDHDAVVGRALANVVAGGPLPHQTAVSEQYLLDLEREAFLKLCGEPKTLERIQYTLKTGKPLRN